MANPELTIDVSMNLTVDDKTLGRALHIVEMWLEDHQDKTIVIEEEEGLRVCLIADEVKGHEAELPGPWISVKDRLPEDSGFFLCLLDTRSLMPFCCACFNPENDKFYISDAHGGVDVVKVTHWMELPKGPKEEANGEESYT